MLPGSPALTASKRGRAEALERATHALVAAASCCYLGLDYLLTTGTAGAGGAAEVGIALGVFAGASIGAELQPRRARLGVHGCWQEAGCRGEHRGQHLLLCVGPASRRAARGRLGENRRWVVVTAAAAQALISAWHGSCCVRLGHSRSDAAACIIIHQRGGGGGIQLGALGGGAGSSQEEPRGKQQKLVHVHACSTSSPLLTFVCAIHARFLALLLERPQLGCMRLPHGAAGRREGMGGLAAAAPCSPLQLLLVHV